MKRLAAIPALSVAVLVCGCASAPRPGGSVVLPLTPPPTSQTIPGILGNWQFNLVSTTPGAPAVTIAGGISRNGTAVSGALHVDGSNCVDRLTTVGFTGTVSADATSLTSAAVNGQVVTFTGNFSDTDFVGTYSIKGGCADGDAGKVMGDNIPYIANNLAGTFTNSANQTFDVSGDIAQSSSFSASGSFEISGTATFDKACFKAGTIRPGTFPSGSFILGRSVNLEFETGNGALIFLGTLSQDRSEMSGNYSVSGGSCDESGTAVLYVSSPWDY
jgi:hypothetical protein